MNEAIDRQLGLPLNLPPGGGGNLTWTKSMYPRLFGVFLRPVDAADPTHGLEPAIGYWNLTPPYQRGPLKSWTYSCNNARSEDMATKRTFASPLKSRRCLIPATAFFEWTGPKGKKTRHRITRRDGEMMFFAGLWEHSRGVDEGPTDTFTMVMRNTVASDDVGPFHDRQPIPLGREAARTWLDLTADYQPALQGPPPGTYVMDPPDARPS